MVYQEPAPAFQLYVDDRLAELVELGMAERGAWTSCVMRIWREGPLPEERLRNIAGGYWETIRFLFAIHSVPSGYAKRSEADHWSLTWLENYRVHITERRAKNFQNGQKGGRPSKKKRSTTPAIPVPETERFPKGNHPGTTRALELEPEIRSTEYGVGEEDRAQDGVQGKENPPVHEATTPPQTRNRRRGPVDAATDTRVAELIEHLTLARNGVSPDGSLQSNQRACAALLQKCATDYPDVDTVELIKTVITAGLADDFHRKNITEFGYLFRASGKIIESHKLRSTKTTTNGKRSATTDVLNDIAAN